MVRFVMGKNRSERDKSKGESTDSGVAWLVLASALRPAHGVEEREHKEKRQRYSTRLEEDLCDVVVCLLL